MIFLLVKRQRKDAKSFVFHDFFSNFDIARFVNHLEIVYCLITFFQASEPNFGQIDPFHLGNVTPRPKAASTFTKVRWVIEFLTCGTKIRFLKYLI